jgi:pyruvate dehydrogenase (quinone)
MATSGPGAIHLLNGLYDAEMDHQPVVAIVGQTATTALGSSYQQEVDLQNLFMPLIHRKSDRSWQDKIITNVKDWWKVIEGRSMSDGNNGLLNPERVFWELSPKLPDRCILAADSGTTANWYARDLKIRRGMMASGSGNLATMGAAVPYAVGAKFYFPDRVCIAVTGDGAMQMNGLNACITVAKYLKEWSDPR